jgi:2-iminobutanoate/2-iminopropanoate deaminase
MQLITTDDVLAKAMPLSAAVVDGTAVYCSGQIHHDPTTGTLVEGPMEVLVAQVLNNLEAVLEAAGSGLDLVLRTNVYLADLADFAAVNDVYAKTFPHKPARTALQVAALPLGARVEIDCIARTRG